MAQARDLGGRRALDDLMIDRLADYFARHRADKRARTFGNEENPSASYIAWLLRGGEAGEAWVAQARGADGPMGEPT